MSEPLNPYYQIDVLNDKFDILSKNFDKQQKEIESLWERVNHLLKMNYPMLRYLSGKDPNFHDEIDRIMFELQKELLDRKNKND